MRGASSIPGSSVVSTSAGSSLINSALHGSGSQTSSPGGPISRQSGRRAADLFSAYEAATSGLHETARPDRESYQTEGQLDDSDRNPSSGMATRFSLIV
jgi:hypothetical protein